MSTKELTADGTARSVSVQGLKLNYHEAGDGYPLLLLHGGGPGASAWSNYNGNIGPLSAHFRVLAFDMPHFGRSDKPADRFIDCTWYAQVLAEALKKIGVKKAHFVGNSMGGIISMEMALTEPDMVDQIILMGVPGAISVITVRPTEGEKHLIGYYAGEGPTPAKLEAFIRVMIHDQSRVTPELLEARYKASTVPELMVKRKLESTALINMWRRAHEIPQKTLLVHGRNDRVVPWDAAMALLNLIPNSDLHVFGNCGHWAQWERAEEFNALAFNFFKVPNIG